MKFCALISGGKDSIYSIYKLTQQGHQCVALANLLPSEGDEVDSHTFQTVGHQAVQKIAEAMELPLFQKTIAAGDSRNVELQYRETAGDEVETLRDLLEEVCRGYPEVAGVSSGAVLSHYQRIRVEHVCRELGLLSLAPLWRIPQAALLDEMDAAGLEAVLVKTACFGLSPLEHCGQSVTALRGVLAEGARNNMINEAGEGGEFETITLYCPGLFRHRLALGTREVIVTDSSPVVQVGYLRCDVTLGPPLPVDSISGDPDPVLSGRPQISTQPAPPAGPVAVRTLPVADDMNLFVGSGENFAAVVQATLSAAQAAVPYPVYNVMAVSDMASFGMVNGIYSSIFTTLPPPARCCVEMPATQPSIAIMPIPGDATRRLHVESVSSWAPACIGPYSQAVSWPGVVGVSGQIPLAPDSMSLTNTQGGVDMCRAHISSILDEFPGAGDVHEVIFYDRRYAEAAGVIGGARAAMLPKAVDVEIVAFAGEEAERYAEAVVKANEMIVTEFQI